MTQLIITRPSFCPYCFEHHYPKINQPYIAYGSGGYHFMRASRNGIEGFTPHIWKLEGHHDGVIVTKSSCAMFGCKLRRKPIQGGTTWFYYLDDDVWETQEFSIERWNGLVLGLKRDLYYFI